ncbi:unnamed protein product [Paramecium primaurelia]|uniref:Uncharacterized protein n=1 Tax=Paramecium primaurelia TaxID=5886 RepID=A0A8S1QXX2_PARPR|nr:unnamed protein product [Paramecium primaurelia]
MQKFTQFDQIEAELKLHKQEKDSLQNQLTESEQINLGNQQVIKDHKKNYAEQIKLIQDLKRQNEGQSIKTKELEQKRNDKIIIINFGQVILLITDFLDNLQASNWSVTQNGKAIETSQNHSWQCCMCDQMIPKNGLIQFAIKIIDISTILTGIGFSYIVQSRNYVNCYEIGQGYIYDINKIKIEHIIFIMMVSVIIMINKINIENQQHFHFQQMIFNC